MESLGQNRPSRRKPHKTHKIVSGVDSGANQAAFSDVDFGAASNVADPQLVEVTQLARHNLTPVKLCSEQFGLPEGTIVVQPEDATDSPFQGPEFFPAESGSSDAVEVDVSQPCQHCTVCRLKLDVSRPDLAYQHSVLNVLLCKRCYNNQQRQMSENKSGTKNYCTWCSAGISLICCDVCPAMFCKTCVRRNLGRDFLDTILDSDDDQKWQCFICFPEPLSSLVQTCSEFTSQRLKSSKAGGKVKRRKSAGSAIYTPQKRQKSAPVITIMPQKLGQGKPTPVRARLGTSQAAVGSPESVVNGGLIAIRRPEYDADMIPVDEHNVWPVLEKLLAATQSMSMLLGSLKDDLQRSSALAARMTDIMATGEQALSDLAVKRREAAVKLWRAFDAYQKSFADIETYSQETSKTVKTGETVKPSETVTGDTCTDSASVADRDHTATTDQSPADV